MLPYTLQDKGKVWVASLTNLNGSHHNTHTSVKDIPESFNPHAINFDDFWPKRNMQSCLPSLATRFTDEELPPKREMQKPPAVA